MTLTTAPTSAARTDRELLADFAHRRHEAAFAEVVRRHGGMVLSVCRSVLGHTSDAEDAAQAVFLTLAQKAHSSTVQGHLVGWLHRVAWYVAARGAEAKAIRRRHEQEAARMRQEIHQSDGEPIQLDILHAGLAKLPEKYRVALILHHMEGRSHEETAALLACSVDAVAVRLHRGRQMLRKRLDQRGIAAAGLGTLWGSPAVVLATFVATASRAATASVAGSLAKATLSGQTLALAKGAINMLFWKKVQAIATVALLLLFAGVAVKTVLISHGANPPAAEIGRTPRPTLPALPPGAITGQITQIANGGIAIHRQNGQTITMPLDAATVVTVDGKPATAADLKIGMDAGAVFVNGRPTTEVRAQTPGGAAPR